jgi:hypothetical protein
MPAASPPPPPPAAPTKASASAEAATTPAAETLPERVLFSSKYGFYTDDGMKYMKEEGTIETNPVMIKLLIDRNAPVLTKESEISDWRYAQDKRRQEVEDAKRRAGLRR